MKEIDYDEFLDRSYDNMKTLKKTGDVCLLTHKGKRFNSNAQRNL